MEKQARIQVLYLDDEPAYLDSFKQAIREVPVFQYVAGFSTAESCLRFIRENKTGFLIFSDVEMPGKNGLWLAEQLKGTNNGVVFLTNHATYAVQAFEASALHFMLKPVTRSKLMDCAEIIKKMKLVVDTFFIERVKDFYEILEKRNPPKRLFIHMADKIEVLTVADIVYLTADASYTIFVLQDSRKVLSSKGIKDYEFILMAHPDFIRIHKSNIINKQFLKTISRKQRSYKAIMSNKDELEISYQRKDEIMEKILV